MKMRDTDNADSYVAEHPVVRTHPETGKKALYVNTRHTIRFKDMTEEESRPLLDFLQAHCTRPEFTARLRWEKGTVAIWDNRCCQHFAINDYHGQRRVLWRLPVGAELPV
jgi:taurine dioxygenase